MESSDESPFFHSSAYFFPFFVRPGGINTEIQVKKKEQYFGERRIKNSFIKTKK